MSPIGLSFDAVPTGSSAVRALIGWGGRSAPLQGESLFQCRFAMPGQIPDQHVGNIDFAHTTLRCGAVGQALSACIHSLIWNRRIFRHVREAHSSAMGGKTRFIEEPYYNSLADFGSAYLLCPAHPRKGE